MWELILLIIGGVCVNSHFIDNAEEVVSTNRILVRSGNDQTRKLNEVETAYGKVQGIERGGILQFFDVPYGAFKAETPFQEPAEPAPWHETREREEHTSRCPQLMKDEIIGDHNCLTLNIFKPYKGGSELGGGDPGGEDEKHAVLFHIHDSSFSTGSGDPLLYGPKGLVEQDIILVLPNYRLGALGFMCLHNASAPGNAALKDLTLALNWTQNNIRNFGGDPSNIVVSGAGAGGALVEYLLISDESRLYISRAITESGSSLSPWAIDRNPLDTASSLTTSVVQGDIIEDLITGSHNIDFRPCIETDNGFITDAPWKLLGNNQSGIVYMSGNANHAAWRKALRLAGSEKELAELNNDLTLLLPDDLIFENREEKLRIGGRVKSLYFGERDITMTDVNQLSQLFTDSGYLNPGLRAARLLVKGGAEVYFYEYSFNNPQLEQAFNASTRGDSLSFVFSTNESATENEEQTRMRNIMTNIWTSFIKTGKPSISMPSADKIEWQTLKEVAPAEEEWLSIGAEVAMRKGIHPTRLRVWQEIYDRHFVDNNSSLVQKPSVYILVSGFSILSFMIINY